MGRDRLVRMTVPNASNHSAPSRFDLGDPGRRWTQQHRERKQQHRYSRGQKAI